MNNEDILEVASVYADVMLDTRVRKSWDFDDRGLLAFAHYIALITKVHAEDARRKAKEHRDQQYALQAQPAATSGAVAWKVVCQKPGQGTTTWNCWSLDKVSEAKHCASFREGYTDDQITVRPLVFGDVAPAGRTSLAAADEVMLVKPADITVERYPQTVSGGMHVGMPSGITITHKPTGCVVTVIHHRSQHRNRDAAIRALTAALNPEGDSNG